MCVSHYTFVTERLVPGIGHILWDEALGEVSSLSAQSPDTKLSWDSFKTSRQRLRNSKSHRER